MLGSRLYALPLLALGLGSLAACGDGSPAYGPPGTVISPLGEVDPALAEQVAIEDGVEGTVPISYAFVDGGPARYWGMGTSSATPQRAAVLCRETGGECDPIDHPIVLEHLPGEAGYSAFGRVTEVRVSAAFAGEVMGSWEAVEDAAADGLATLEERNAYINCPIVAPDVRVETDDATRAPRPAYVRDMQAQCMLFGSGGRLGLGELGTTEGAVLIRNVYVLTRDGEDGPLVEGMRMEDLTGDGDQVDSNNIFGVGLDSVEYTPLWRMVTVTVPAGYASIDSALDQTVADYRDARDMFDVDPVTYGITPLDGRVVAYEETDTLVNCPLLP